MNVLRKVFSQQTFLVFQDTLKTSSRRLQRKNISSSQTFSRRVCKTSFKDVFKKSSQDVFKMSSKVSLRSLASMSWRRLEVVFKTSLKTKRIMLKSSSTRLHQDECFWVTPISQGILKIGSKWSHELWRINHRGNCPELCFDKSCSAKNSTLFTRIQQQMNSFLVKMLTKAFVTLPLKGLNCSCFLGGFVKNNKSFSIFTRKHLCWSVFLIKLQACKPATSFKRDFTTSLSGHLWTAISGTVTSYRIDANG